MDPITNVIPHCQHVALQFTMYLLLMLPPGNWRQSSPKLVITL